MRKFSFLSLILIATSSLQAQWGFTEAFDSVFVNISRTDATTGILYERVLPFSNLKQFSGNNPDTANGERFLQAYSELYNAAFDSTKRLPFDGDSLKMLIANNTGYIDIGILHYRFNTMDSAVASQKLYFGIDSVLFENTAVTASLYNEDTVLLIVPFKESFYENNLTFRFSSLFQFDNTNNPITHLQVNFDDGNGWQIVGLNSTITVNYPQIYEGVICFIVTYSNGQSDTCYARITIGGPMYAKGDCTPPAFQTSGGKYNNRMQKDIPFIGHDIYTDYDKKTDHNTGNVWVYYANTDKILRKPILIVDGFDPGNVRQHEKHTGESVGGVCGKSIWAMLKIEGQNAHLGDTLIQRYGYDLVVLDLPDGGGYIERNAMVAIKVIQWINDRLQESGSGHEIVVVGPSMGGLITRCALKYMENNETTYGKHNCRLWVSYDSPHQGANISLGAQRLLEYLSPLKDEAKKKYNDIICCPAAQQMLMHHNESGASTIYNKYYTGLKSLGYPNNLRRVAVSNGSLHNTSNGTAAGMAFEAELSIIVTGFDFFIRNVGNSSSTVEVFKGRYNILFVPIIKKLKWTNNTGKCSPDVAPGCWYNTFDQIAEAFPEFWSIVWINQQRHCFMPTTSVLDISGNMDYCTHIASMDLVAQGKTPFHSYCGPGHSGNMEHVTFNTHIKDWLINEVETYIEPGDREIPLCDIVPYTVNLPAGKTSSITWTCSDNLEIVSGQGTKTIQVRAIGVGDGWVCATPTSSSLLTHNKEHKYTVKVINSSSYSPAPAINVSATWGYPYIIDSTLTIKNGVTLTIISTVYCTPMTKIIVESGGSLFINGGVLTNVCNGLPWQGIEVRSGGLLTINGQGQIQNASTIDIAGGTLQLTNNVMNVVEIAGNTDIMVKNGGYVCAENGMLNLYTNIRLRVVSGGTLHLKNTSLTKLTGNSSIKVEDGGYICVEENAVVNLMDPNTRIDLLMGTILGVNPNINVTSTGNCASICDREVVIGDGIVDCECVPFIPDTELDYENNDYIINENFGIKNELRVKSGATVTFENCTLHFAKNAKIIVEPGGKLIIDGGVLTNACAGELWQGIEVGKAVLSSARGVLELKNGAIIENAECGVRLGGDNYNGGGIIKANNAHFINNKQSVRFDQYLGGSHGSKFNDCKFILNNDAIFTHASYSHQSYKAQVALDYVFDVSFVNCTFEDNRIKNSKNDYIIGIYANWSNIKVGSSTVIPYSNYSVGCSFSGFDRAIQITGSFENYPSQIYSSTFTNNHIAIEAESVQNFIGIGNCQFQISSLSSHFTESNIGIYLKGTSLYNVVNNYFSGMGATTGQGTIGIVTENTGSSNNFIKSNTFENLCAGSMAIKINSNNNDREGLVYQCNSFVNNCKDIQIAENSSIRNRQSGSDITKATGNIFSGSNCNIYNEGYDFEYQYLPPNDPSNPHYPSSVGQPRGFSLTPKPNGCCISHGYAGDNYYMTECAPLLDLSGLNNKYITAKDVYDAKDDDPDDLPEITINWEDAVVISIIEQLEMLDNDEFTITIGGRMPETDLEKKIVLYYELSNLKQYMDIACYSALEILANDSNGLDIQQYILWVSRFNTVESDYLLADIYMNLGNFTQSENILNLMPSKFRGLDTIVHQHYWDYLSVVQQYTALEEEDTIPSYLITELVRLSSYEDIVGIKAYSLGEKWFGYGWAGAIEPQYFEVHPSCICSDGTLPQGIAGNNNSDENEENEQNLLKNLDKKAEITLKPNPTTGELQVISYELQVSEIQIYSVIGQLLYQINKSTNNPINNEISIDVSHLEKGIYFLKIITDSRIVMKKVVKN